MRTIIAGSRTASWEDVVAAVESCPWIDETSEVVSGTAKGADTFGEVWASMKGIPTQRYPADWALYGKAAGAIRNRKMAENSDALVAVYDGKSPGTKNMIDEAKKVGLKVYVYVFPEH